MNALTIDWSKKVNGMLTPRGCSFPHNTNGNIFSGATGRNLWRHTENQSTVFTSCKKVTSSHLYYLVLVDSTGE